MVKQIKVSAGLAAARSADARSVRWIAASLACLAASCGGRVTDIVSAGQGGTSGGGAVESGGVTNAGGTTGTGGAAGTVSSAGGNAGAGGSGGAAVTYVGPVGTILVDAGAATCPEVPTEVAQSWIAFDSDRNGYNRDIYMVRGDGSQVRVLVATPGVDKEPAFAPDGKRLAYASDRLGTMQVHVVTIASGGDIVLTKRPEGADQPSWSRDGSFLVFHSGASVYRVDANGENERLIATGLSDFNAYEYPSLSKDGLEVVFDRNNEIDVVAIGGGPVRYIVQNWTTTIETPAVSEDGASIAFGVFCANVEQIAVVAFAGTTNPCDGTFVSPQAGGTARRPAWGPGKYLAYERGGGWQAPGPAAITIIAGPGSTPCDVVSDAWTNHNPSFGHPAL
jgi:dipeptidyl aminopeptidase/acylaminoacyl peptidase